MRTITYILICLAFSAFAWSQGEDDYSEESIVPLPLQAPLLDSKKVNLGRLLFHEVKLSRTNLVSCASCHDLDNGGMDGNAKSFGVDGAIGNINAPTVFNSGFNFRQFWNGRAKTLEEQIEGPIQHPVEMGSRWADVVEKLKNDKVYANFFIELYRDGVTAENIKNAIATFEKALVTPNSRFDRYLRGEKNILSAQEKKGYLRFKTLGCIACHQGINVGGNMFQTMGVMDKYFENRGTPLTEADLGRFSVTKEEQDRHVFRVPSLRNVELTAPYFHDGSAEKLEDAVKVMAHYQLGVKLSKSEVDSIVAFLKTLTGEKPSILKQEARSKVPE